MIEEYAFQALYEKVVIKSPHYTFSVSDTGELNASISLTFPQKLWAIVESDQFQSICCDESGTCIVINEELFKKEVLERKVPFRVFETNSMKSLTYMGLVKSDKIFKDLLHYLTFWKKKTASLF